MNKNTQPFSVLGKILLQIAQKQAWKDFSAGISEEEYVQLDELIKKQFYLNGWFTEESVRNTLRSWGELLTTEKLEQWLSGYQFDQKQPKRIGIIMAGNIPLVGFHDFLSVVLSGHTAVIKLSSDDQTLLPAMIDILTKLQPELASQIELAKGKLGKVDAIIATGSNNSMNYFESYFGHLPHLFRKNRTSFAILTGNESKEELTLLGKDIFTYFGLGCRNVSQLFIPENFELSRFFEAIIPYSEVVNHHKYANNYDYNKAIHLMNQANILDNGFVLLKESDELFSPLAMIYYHRYKNIGEFEEFIKLQKENIQSIIGKQYIPFGQAQCPALSDYADGTDTLRWLESI